MKIGFDNWFLLTVLVTLGLACGKVSTRPIEITPEITDTIAIISAPSAIYFDSALLDSFIKSHPKSQRFSRAYHDFYAARNYQFVWYNNSGLSETAFGLSAHLMDLWSKDSAGILYRNRLDSLMDSDGLMIDSLARVETELLLTGLYFYYTEQLLAGVDESISRKLGWLIPRRKISLPALLDSFLVAKKWDDFEKNVLNAQYFKLRNALGIYQRLEKEGGEISIPLLANKAPKLKQGDTSQIIFFLPQRLNQLEYSTALADPNCYLRDMNKGLILAKRAFGLKDDSVIDISIIRSLNVKASEREKQLLVNMERFRWVPANIDSNDLIFINIPEFKLHYFRNKAQIFECNVVVGTPVHKTVIFSGIMDYVVFRPYWYVPQSIIQNEIGVSRAKTASYLRSHNMEWSGGFLREKPGPRNSLGLVKFIFPNSNSIYLHDTPSKSLFNRDSRAFSHGCIRVGEPVELAKLILSYDTSWNEAAIKAAMQSGDNNKVILKRKVPVYIGYFTAFADKDGVVHYLKDVYKRDEQLLESLIK